MSLHRISDDLSALAQALTAGTRLRDKPPQYIVDLTRALRSKYGDDIRVGDGWKPSTHEWWFYKGKSQLSFMMYEVKAAGRDGQKMTEQNLDHYLYLGTGGLQRAPVLKQHGSPIDTHDILRAVERMVSADPSMAFTFQHGVDLRGLTNKVKQQRAWLDRLSPTVKALQEKSRQAADLLAGWESAVSNLEARSPEELVEAQTLLDDASKWGKRLSDLVFG